MADSARIIVRVSVEGIVTADCDLRDALHAKRYFDVAGHYGRPDIFRLEVNREVRAPIDFATKP